MVTITVNDSGVINALRGAKSKVIPKIKAGLFAGGSLITNEAKRIVPFITHTLQRSIHTEPVEEKPGEFSVKISTSKLSYAAKIEFGGSRKAPQGYLRPALDEKENEAIQEIKDSIKILFP